MEKHTQRTDAEMQTATSVENPLSLPLSGHKEVRVWTALMMSLSECFSDNERVELTSVWCCFVSFALSIGKYVTGKRDKTRRLTFNGPGRGLWGGSNFGYSSTSTSSIATAATTTLDACYVVSPRHFGWWRMFSLVMVIVHCCRCRGTWTHGVVDVVTDVVVIVGGGGAWDAVVNGGLAMFLIGMDGWVISGG